MFNGFKLGIYVLISVCSSCQISFVVYIFWTCFFNALSTLFASFYLAI